MLNKPHLINFNQIGEPSIGYISVAEAENNIPFKIERVFWTYFTPHNIVRGHHAHYITEQVLIAVSGMISVYIVERSGKKSKFMLDNPNMGLYLPPNVWHTMEYSHDAVQMVLASTKYNESDYIRSFEDFINTKDS
ncbi:MAG: FdtA/QdtA family cupin domain-containing protein [Flavobacteriaceae bacterium]